MTWIERFVVGALASIAIESIARAETVAVVEAPVVESERAQTSGRGVSAGIGNQYPIIGVQAAYYFQLPRSIFRMTPYAGIGAALCPAESSAACTTGGVFGVMAAWGRRHRFMVDAFYGTVGTSYFSFHGEMPDTDRVWGAGLAIGYEYMARSGFFVRTDAGASYALGPPIWAPKDRFSIALTLIGVGYKFL